VDLRRGRHGHAGFPNEFNALSRDRRCEEAARKLNREEGLPFLKYPNKEIPVYIPVMLRQTATWRCVSGASGHLIDVVGREGGIRSDPNVTLTSRALAKLADVEMAVL